MSATFVNVTFHKSGRSEKMKAVLIKADTRGHANHGWLSAFHSFSFANYYDPERIHFGVLRVLNDDTIEAGMGFGKHPHDNMEIITIPLEGVLKHKDSMGNEGIIRQGEVQVMSAGSGIFHSEFNAQKDEHLKLLQIWVFPNKRNVAPRYDQISIRDLVKKNELYQILSPNPDDDGVWIHQNAWFHMGDLTEGTNLAYSLKGNHHGVYVFLLEGEAEVAGHVLERRDAITIENEKEISLQATSDAKVLLMEVPLNID